MGDTVGAAPGFGDRLRFLRNRALLTQDELARRAGIGRRTVLRLEAGGAATPQGATRRLLCAALGLDPVETDWLLTGDGAHLPAPSAPDPLAALPPALPLVGREHDLDTIATLLDTPSTRLITLTGPGGVGKTRLAMETIRVRASQETRRVAFVPLAPIADPDDVLPAIAAALDLAPAGAGMHDAFARAVAREPILLALDNLEHLLAAVPDLAWLLRAAPRLTMLVTSRESLRLQEERVMVVQPLPVDPGDTPAVELFRLRASQARLAAEADTWNEEEIAILCRRLGGLPLAIELAAAQMDVLDPSDLLALMDEAGLGALAPGLRNETHRFATMDEAIAWSWNQLQPEHQRLLSVLSVFADGFDVSAATVTLAGVSPGTADAAAVAAAIPDLTRRHIVQRQSGVPAGEPPRFTMLEPIRLFALDRLRAAGQETAAHHAHATWALGRLTDLTHGIAGPTPAQTLDRMERDYANFRAALDWAIANGDGDLVGKIAVMMFPLWQYRDQSDDATRRLERALALPDLPPEARGICLLLINEIAHRRGDQDRLRTHAEEQLAFTRGVGAEIGIASALLHLSLAAPDEPDRATALAPIREARALITSGVDWDPPFLDGWSAARLGIELHRAGDLDGARAALEQATITRHRPVRGLALPGSGGHLGLVLDDLGEPRAAAAAIVADLQVARGLGDRWTIRRLAGWLLAVLLPHAPAEPGLAAACADLQLVLATDNRRFGSSLDPAEDRLIADALASVALPPPIDRPLALALDAACAHIASLPEQAPPRPGARLTLPPLI